MTACAISILQIDVQQNNRLILCKLSEFLPFLYLHNDRSHASYDSFGVLSLLCAVTRSWKLITRRKSLRAGRKIPVFQSFRFPNTLFRLSNIAVHPINQNNQNKRVRFAFFLSQRLRRASDMTSSLLRKPFCDTGKNNITNVIAQKLFLDCLLSQWLK